MAATSFSQEQVHYHHRSHRHRSDTRNTCTNRNALASHTTPGRLVQPCLPRLANHMEHLAAPMRHVRSRSRRSNRRRMSSAPAQTWSRRSSRTCEPTSRRRSECTLRATPYAPRGRRSTGSCRSVRVLLVGCGCAARAGSVHFQFFTGPGLVSVAFAAHVESRFPDCLCLSIRSPIRL